MRIRRLPTKGKLLSSIRTSRSTALEGQVDLPPAQHVLPKPSAASPLHPAAFYTYLGDYKYGTGPITLSPALQNRIKSSYVSLKVYSTEPVSQRNVRTTLETALRNSHSGESSRSALHQLFFLAASVYSSSSKISNVYFQVFERYPGRFDPRRTTSVARNRPWALSCELYRHVSGVSKPLVVLDIGSIYLGRLCTIQGRSMHNRALHVKLHFHMRTSVLQLEASTDQRARVAEQGDPVGAFQPFIDQILNHVLLSVRRSNFVDEKVMLLTIESSILTCLRSSSFAPLVDFHHLELELHTLRKNRFVSATFLNADGTKRDARTDYEDKSEVSASMSARLQARQSSSHSNAVALPGPFPAEVVDQNIKAVKEMPRIILSDGNRQLSEASQARAGMFNIVQISTSANEQHQQSRMQATPTEVFEIYDNLCANAPTVGLACFAYATALMASQFRNLSARLDTNSFPVPISPPRPSIKQEQITLKIQVRNGLHWFELRLPFVDGLQFSISQTSIRTKRCIVNLVGKYQRNAASQSLDSPQPQISTADEANVLTQMATTVMESLAKGIKFDSYEAVPVLLAEGLLRTVQFLSPNITLEGVQVTVVLPADSPLGSCEIRDEKWREHNAQAISHQATTTPEDSVISPETPNNVQGSEKAIPDSKEAVQQDEMERATGLNDNYFANEDSTLSTEQDDLPSISGTGTNNGAPNHRDSKPSSRGRKFHGKEAELPPLLERKFGFNTSGFAIRWEPSDFASISDLTPDRLRSLLTDALEHVPMASLRGVWIAIKSLFETMPIPKGCVFYVKRKRSQVPAGAEFLVSEDDNAVVYFYLDNYVAINVNNWSVNVRPSAIRGLSFQIDQLQGDANLDLSMRFNFKGTIAQNESEAPKVDSASQVNDILLMSYDIVNPILTSSSFSSLQGLTNRAAHMLISHRDRFKDIFEVHTVTVNSRISDPTKQYEVVQLAKASSSTEGRRNGEQPTDVEQEIDAKRENNVEHETHAEIETIVEQETTPIRYETQGSMDRVYIALGSNLGDRLQNIEKACQELNKVWNTSILRTSALYETAPMYVEDQRTFLNGVCEIETKLSPIGLLNELQRIETRLGRVKTIDKGPRNIDLDILLYKSSKINTERLTVPHPLMLEREFVLRPLCDIPTATKRRHERTSASAYENFLNRIATPAQQQMYPILSLATEVPDIHIGSPKEKTRVMSIMNITPDSFSDGGLHSPQDLEQLKSSIRLQIQNGATIIDIGGQSSRPNAPDVTAEEEVSRVLPAIEAIKSIPEAAKMAISIDTYRAAVAEAAIKAGAHVINDISAGMLDEDMLPTIARLGCTYVMMHMRGTPSTMMSEENCSYPDGLIPTINSELAHRVEAAQAAGIRRWRIVLDPGIGFSKNADQNLDILRNMKELKQSTRLRNFAWLVGSSRKSFIGKVTGVEDPKERGWGTAATVTAAIQGGADIVRVHDAAEMSAVVKMADAMYRV